MFSGPASGLWTSPNPFAKVPAGSLRVADNVVFVAPSVIEPRRGFEEMESSSFGDADSLADQLALYGVNVLVAYDFTKVAIKPPDGPFFEWPETFAPKGDNRLRFEPAARSIFFNPASGIRVFDGTAGFFTSTVTATALRALGYSGGAGDMAGTTEVTGGTSGAVGTILVYLGQDVAAGTFAFVAVTGAFVDGEALTGDTGWTGVSVGPDTLAIAIDDYTVAVVPGLNIAGQTSGATAVIGSVVPGGIGGAVLGVREVIGTFAAEVIAVGESTLAPTMAGCPQGLNILATNASNDGWQLPDTAVAYRFTVCRKDAFGRIVEGPPSGRTVLRNLIRIGIGALERDTNSVRAQTFQPDSPTYLEVGDVVTLRPGEGNFPPGDQTIASVDSPQAYEVDYPDAGVDALNTVVQFLDITRSANLSLYLPDDVTVAHFVRVYRSVMTGAASDVPDDELYQCYESAYLSEAEVAAGVLTFNDVAPESVIEVPLYTNAGAGDGSLAANYLPPLALDLAYWQNRMWYLNTTDKHSAQLALIGVGSPDGLQDGDEITFLPTGGALGTDDITLTAETGTVGANEFQVFTDGDPGYNIQRTAQALAQAINDSSADGMPYAFYVSSEEGTPGKLYLQARAFGDAAGFSVYSSRPTAWTPQLPNNTTPVWPALKSTDNAHAARLCWSKLGQPEAVPLLNNVQIDADNYPALKLAPLNYRLLVFKTDGIYFIPTGLPVSLQKLSDHVLLAPDSVARLGDAVYCLTDQGVIAVSDSGQVEVSLPIQELLSNLNGATSIADLRTRTFAVTYRSNEQYILWVIERSEADVFTADNAQAFVFSTRELGFTRYTFGARTAVIDAVTDTLVVAPVGDNQLWRERKSLTDADYFDVGEAAIDTDIVFNDFTEEAPAVMKMTQQASFLFRENSVPTITTSFASEIHPARIEVPLETEGWGEFSWGEVPWGGYVRIIRRVQPLPMGAANCCQLSVGFSASCAGTKFGFLGIDLDSDGDTKANHG